MEKDKIKKVLYKEKPIAKQTVINEDSTIEYTTTTSLGEHKFIINPKDNELNEGHLLSDAKEIPAQLLIRWLV